MSYDKRARYIAKQLGKESGSAKTILAKLEKVMTDDGAGHLYAKHVKPLEALITKGIQKAKSKG